MHGTCHWINKKACRAAQNLKPATGMWAFWCPGAPCNCQGFFGMAYRAGKFWAAPRTEVAYREEFSALFFLATERAAPGDA